MSVSNLKCFTYTNVGLVAATISLFVPNETLPPECTKHMWQWLMVRAAPVEAASLNQDHKGQ